jgi:hypothetical protein
MSNGSKVMPLLFKSNLPTTAYRLWDSRENYINEIPVSAGLLVLATQRRDDFI